MSAAFRDVWIDEATLAHLAATDRLRPVLCRMGGCRFTAHAQDARKIIDALEAAGDYCRDVSYRDPIAAPPPRPEPHRLPAFDDRHVGGAFDGNTVTSDADGGL